MPLLEAPFPSSKGPQRFNGGGSLDFGEGGSGHSKVEMSKPSPQPSKLVEKTSEYPLRLACGDIRNRLPRERAEDRKIRRGDERDQLKKPQLVQQQCRANELARQAGSGCERFAEGVGRYVSRPSRETGSERTAGNVTRRSGSRKAPAGGYPDTKAALTHTQSGLCASIRPDRARRWWEAR